MHLFGRAALQALDRGDRAEAARLMGELRRASGTVIATLADMGRQRAAA